ncbi:MAG: amino acid ABC transporter substrate-binding protein [Phenylobacterium sp.]|uniref:amino acid ABC transporter substrate-binding protein n=1 Tax=Brevundimonas sp. TaxID=1871086 RepID=UPI002737989E|nr:amino acid ABC transporter substrate-binding protein [Brevundimonas sp.]MDP3800687.1 amino acid ABC transporter substrate-binding protein [Brevundimonas sp.]MDZ4373585.1 amino acid ABC transporter substrate-binding protein [Phenylobacterium sp.]
MRTRRAGRRAADAGLALLIGLILAACGRGEPEADAGKGAEAEPGTQTAAPEFASPTLAAIKRRGRLNCGVHEGLVGFAYTDNRGEWRGFDADFCRALAAAVLGDARAVRFVPLTGSQRFEALRSGRVDVLWRSTSWTLTREAREGIRFAGVNYYDGQGFLVRRSLDLASAAELNGARVCVQRATTSELNVADWFRARDLEYTPVPGANEEAARAAYAREDCDALTADISALAAARTTLSNPEQHALLPDVISKEPLGPAVRRGDEAWTSIVRWTLHALILAEELGVTSGNADRLAGESPNPQIRRLLGVEGEIGPLLGLRKDWAKSAIQAEGNYGEIFSRNVGTDSPLDLARGLNAQWNATPGGLIYALPIR